ncbi:hypothetical protein HD554DRAFT_2270467 [Boletus coccyginus]|nr:hypothetical protein HD554DRAFT_2270467 [Boletus coccyginus]
MSTDSLIPLFGPLYGSLYFATVMSSGFYGVACMQTLSSLRSSYQNDPLRTKSFVAAVWALSTTHEALIISGAYKHLMAGLANPFTILNGTPELIALAAATTQGFFVYRIYLFSEKNMVAPIIWVVLAVAQSFYVGKALYSSDGIQAVEITTLADNPFKTLATSGLSITAGIDILIAIFLTFLLIRKRSAIGYSSTAHVLQRLTVFAVNTGTWTAMFAFLSLILLHVFPSNMIYTVFVTPICPIYCNTLLANLNARAYIRAEATRHNGGVDLFTTSTSRVCNNTRCENQCGDANLVSPARQVIWKTTEVVTFTDPRLSPVVDNE